MTHLFRKGDGEPIRAAMREKGLSGPKLAKVTRTVDPDGKGISPAAVGQIAGQGKTAKDRCRIRSAWLIADALESPLQALFSLTMPTDSTSTVERSRSDAHEG
jgi:hypothetical protein